MPAKCLAVTACFDQRSAGAAFVPRPAEIRARRPEVDLFVIVPTGLADEQSTLSIEAHRKRIAQTILVYLRDIGIERCAGLVRRDCRQSAAGEGINPQDLASKTVEILNVGARGSA